MLIMKKYHGHCKVNGPCVNVPTTLDQVIHMLPCMSDQLQLHAVKLKRKLEYKSHYMFHLIQKKKKTSDLKKTTDVVENLSKTSTRHSVTEITNLLKD